MIWDKADLEQTMSSLCQVIFFSPHTQNTFFCLVDVSRGVVFPKFYKFKPTNLKNKTKAKICHL